MFIAYLMQWWYGPGWVLQWRKIAHRTNSIGRAYSGKTLLKTLFSPWKRIIAYKNPNASIEDKLRGLLDNLVSRVIGAIVRFFTLVAALLSLVFVAVFSLVLALVWPLLPLLSIFFVLKGFGLL